MLARISALAILLLASGVFSPVDARADRGKTPVYVIRAGGGFYPNLERIAREKYGNERIVVRDYFFRECSAAARNIVEEHRKGRLPEGVFLVGYSLGGVGAISVARDLEGAGIPVRSLILVETINPVQTIPANVRECFNLYHAPAIFGFPVRANSEKTDLVNCRVVRDAKIEQIYIHPIIPLAGDVHEFVTGQLLRAMSGKPIPNSLRYVPPDPEPRVKPKAEGRGKPDGEGLFKGIFGKKG